MHKIELFIIINTIYVTILNLVLKNTYFGLQFIYNIINIYMNSGI